MLLLMCINNKIFCQNLKAIQTKSNVNGLLCIEITNKSSIDTIYLLSNFTEINIKVTSPKNTCIYNIRGRKVLYYLDSNKYNPLICEHYLSDSNVNFIRVLPNKSYTLNIDINRYLCKPTKRKITGMIDIYVPNNLKDYCPKLWVGKISRVPFVYNP